MVGMVADFVPVKNHERFLEAFYLARQKEPALFALIVGGARDSEGEKLFQKLQGKADENCYFTGHVRNAMPYFQKMSLLCSLTDKEAFGRNCVEALSLGVRVLAADDGGPAEIIGDMAGCRLVHNEPAKIAEEILSVLKENNPQPDKAWFDNFAIHRHAHQLEEIIESHKVA